MSARHSAKFFSKDEMSQKKLSFAEGGDEIDKLVSLTFDESPKVRKKVAEDLAKCPDDPRALLALLELSSDKDAHISKIAKEGLGSFKKEDEEALTSLEKFFEEARQASDTAHILPQSKSRLMPSLEKLFTKKGARDKLMPSLEKFFFYSQQAENEAEEDEDSEEIQSTSSQNAPAQDSKSPDALSHIDYIQKPRTLVEFAEESVGVPARLQNPKLLKRRIAGASPSEAELEEAANFPIPEHLHNQLHSPMSSIPALSDELMAELVQEDEKLPLSRLDYYKWAYALAITPDVKSSDLKKERDRLIKEAKANITLAFKLAVSRAHQEGIESIGALKPGMKKLSTLPLEVLDHRTLTLPKGKKKEMQLSRLLLSDGKTSMPLYIEPQRAEGLRTGDLVSLRGAYVDYFLNNCERDAPDKGELVFLLGKKGQIIITK